MVSNKVADLERSDADTLTGGDLGCLLNIAGRLSRQGKVVKVLHIAEILAGMGENPGIGEAGP
jgi:L-lactate dehydrogenase complex protein LldE